MPTSPGRILTVGIGSAYQYHTIASAIAASQNGDTIRVQAGTYTNDTAIISTSINLQAVGGRVVMNETVAVPNQKGILVVGTQNAAPTVSIDGFDFSGAKTPNGGNAAGVRYQNGDLTLTNDYFHNNQNGILATPVIAGTGSILIDHSEFAFNGSGNGLTHNIYIGDVGSFTLTNSYSHDTAEGHEVKSRAENNTITNNRIFDNASTSSYSIDLPNGGNALISQNTIEQGARGHNPVIIAYGEEGALHAGQSFQVSGNTIVNDMASATMVWNQGAGTAQLSGNQLFGIPAGKILSGAGSETGDTVLTTRPTLDTTSHPYGVSTPPPASPPVSPPASPPSVAQPNLTATFDPATNKVLITGTFVNNSPVLLYGAADGRAVGPGTGTGFSTIQRGSASSFSTKVAVGAVSTYTVESIEGGVVDRAMTRISSGAATFNLRQDDVMQDLLSGVRIGQDHLHITNAAGVVLSAAATQALIAGATSDAQGNAVLHLSPTHDVTLSGVAVAKVSAGLFA
ncbi:MAG: right-handed parallel beta-helix repeat-containing protein [Alphaproteobacteria bacterium]|nr:right-handed parallel beta-helix repeat-containing protein [Alphaproteobacteria bacterium]